MQIQAELRRVLSLSRKRPAATKTHDPVLAFQALEGAAYGSARDAMAGDQHWLAGKSGSRGNGSVVQGIGEQFIELVVARDTCGRTATSDTAKSCGPWLHRWC